VEVSRASPNFPVYVTLSLATNDLIVAVCSISSVLSVYRSYILSIYCRRMLQTDRQPAGRPTTGNPLS